MNNRNRILETAPKILAMIILIFAFIACDEVNAPYRQSGTGDNNLLTNKRKIVLEEYTGFKCGNCPRATKLAHQLEAANEGQVILLSVHAGGYAVTDKTGLYTYDFRTPESEELYKHFGITANPVALVSRATFSGNQIVYEASWAAKVAELMKTEPKMLIRMFRDYDAATRELYLDVEITYLTEGEASHRLALYILEDKIIKPQTDYSKTPVDLEEYEHNNVLRGSINGTWGEQLSNGKIPAGYVIRREYHYTVPQGKDWVPENLKILAFVQDHGKTYEIYQAEEIKLVK
jgi:hypothetical protein